VIRPILALAALALASCATRPAELVPDLTAPVKTGDPVTVRAAGGAERSNLGAAGVSNDALRSALETALVDSELFKRVAPGGYQLEAFLIDLTQPAMGFNMTVEVQVDYVLRRGGRTIWRDSIVSTHTTTVGEAFAAADRVRLATEGAVRENIRQAILAIAHHLR